MEQSVAVIGSGVAGLTAAYLLRDTHRVTVFEASNRAGGHAHTHAVDGLAIDSGFIVHNDRNYPNLRRLFSEVGVVSQPTEMSMSIRDQLTGAEYAGGRGLGGIIAQPARLANPRFVKMLFEVKRFHRLAAELLATTAPPGQEPETFGEFLHKHSFSAYFRRHFAIPLVSCVWSSGAQVSLQYPARYLFEFLRHHGMLSVTGSPQWFTVQGGSADYVSKLVAAIGDVRLARTVTAVSRGRSGVTVTAGGDELAYDRVVIATHPDQALTLLSDPTQAEKATLSAFQYSTNDVVLHTDRSLMPRASRARASWNYLTPDDSDKPVVTYWMNRLQRLPGATDYFVTLNAGDRIAADQVLARMTYQHPVYTPESVAASAVLPELNSATTVYAGAYHGWGFHEDGCASGVRAAKHFGATW